MQLASPTPALCLRRRQGLAAALIGHGLRGRHRGRGTRRKTLEQAPMLGAEARAVDRIARDQRPVGSTSKHERDDQLVAGAEAEPAETVLLKPRAVEPVGQPRRLAGAQRRAGDGVLETQSDAEEPLRKVAGAGGDHQIAVALELDHERPSGDQRPAALGD